MGEPLVLLQLLPQRFANGADDVSFLEYFLAGDSAGEGYLVDYCFF
jgi:hypothetical protein